MSKMSYEDYMKKVDKYLLRKVGLTHMDLPDYHYWDSYNEGATPKEVAEDAIEYAMGG